MQTVRSFQYHYQALESVCVGKSVVQELPLLIAQQGAKRVFLLSTASVSRATDQFVELRQALGGRFAGLCDNIAAHSPRQQVLAAAAAAREVNADLLVTLGGGSVIDAGKVVQLVLDQNIESEAQLLDYAQFSDGSRGSKYGEMSTPGKQPGVRQIAIPTTLSGAEFSNNAGILDTKKAAKEGYRGSRMCPLHIIYDPYLSVHTPQWLWLSTAIRSVDHAVEGYCSADSHGFLQGHFLHAMRMFARCLPQSKKDPEDLVSRSHCQQAVWMACNGLGTVAHGASHGIGYILGSMCGVPHGYTSCVMLPAVLEWNNQKNAKQQTDIASALGQPDTSAAQAVRDLVNKLELPATLQDVGVSREQLPEIARRAIKHPVVRNNPRRLDSAEQVEEILALAWS